MCHAFFFFKDNKKDRRKTKTKKENVLTVAFSKCSRMQIKSTISVIIIISFFQEPVKFDYFMHFVCQFPRMQE